MEHSNQEPVSEKLKINRELEDDLVLRQPQPRNYVGWNSLPAEIRLEIYYYLIPRFQQSINVSCPTFENRFFPNYEISVFNAIGSGQEWKHILPWTKILLINKQISHECLDILYGKNSFVIEMHKKGEKDLLMNFTRENRQRMRYITIAFSGTEGYNFPPRRLVPIHDLWEDVLPTVKELWIIIIQPFRPPPLNQVRPADELWVSKLWERFNRYLEWLPPYFERFGELLPLEMGVNFMTDDGLESKKIAKRYLIAPQVFVEYSLNGSKSGSEENDGIECSLNGSNSESTEEDEEEDGMTGP